MAKAKSTRQQSFSIQLASGEPKGGSSAGGTPVPVGLLAEFGTLYAAAGENYRYFLSWRDKLLAGHMAGLGAIAYSFHYAYSGGNVALARLLLMAASFLTLVIILLEHRNRDLYRANQRAALELEQLLLKSSVSSAASCEILGCSVPTDELRRVLPYVEVSKSGDYPAHSETIDLYFVGILAGIALLPQAGFPLARTGGWDWSLINAVVAWLVMLGTVLPVLWYSSRYRQLLRTMASEKNS